MAAAHGRPEAKDLEVAARQAPRSARRSRAARLDVRAVRVAEAVASRLPDVQDVSRARGQAAPRARPVTRAARDDPRRGRRARRRPRSGRGRRRRARGCVRVDRADPVRPPSLDAQGLELVRCTESIEMHEKPADAVRGKPDSSLVRAVRAVGDGETAAVVSAGNTGAMLAALAACTFAAFPVSCGRGSRS